MASDTGTPAKVTAWLAWSGLHGSTMLSGAPSRRSSRQFQAGLQAANPANRSKNSRIIQRIRSIITAASFSRQ
jgi:hypothetical protein